MKIVIVCLVVLVLFANQSEATAFIQSILKIPEMKEFLAAFKEKGSHEMALRSLEGMDKLISRLSQFLAFIGGTSQVSLFHKNQFYLCI